MILGPLKSGPFKNLNLPRGSELCMLYVLMPPGSPLNAPKGICGLCRSMGGPRAYLKWLRSQSSTRNVDSNQPSMQLNSHHQLFTRLSSGCHGLPNMSCGFWTLGYLYLWVPENPHTSLPARDQTSPARCVTIQQQSASSSFYTVATDLYLHSS